MTKLESIFNWLDETASLLAPTIASFAGNAARRTRFVRRALPSPMLGQVDCEGI
jgi:hypothetical protein